MFEQYAASRGGLPRVDHGPTSEQLSAVRHLLDTGGPPRTFASPFLGHTVTPPEAAGVHRLRFRLPDRGMEAPGTTGSARLSIL
eukprot:6859612-Lingulodinium_polyedra.AAC.1